MTTSNRCSGLKCRFDTTLRASLESFLCVAQFGRVAALDAGGRRFESYRADQFNLSLAQSSRALRLGRRGPGSEASMGDHFNADVAQLIERDFSKVDVTGLTPVVRSSLTECS